MNALLCGIPSNESTAAFCSTSVANSSSAASKFTLDDVFVI